MSSSARRIDGVLAAAAALAAPCAFARAAGPAVLPVAADVGPGPAAQAWWIWALLALGAAAAFAVCAARLAALRRRARSLEELARGGARELAAAEEAAADTARSRAAFLANMSHEIRTPLNGVIGLTQVVLDTKLEPDQRECLQLAQLSAHSLLGLIDDILDFAEIDAGKMELERREFDPRELFGDAARMSALRAHQKKIELGLRIAADAPRRVFGDDARLRQIVVNLVGNAVKFTSAGGVRIVVEAASGPAPRGMEGRVGLRVAVADDGIGIPQDRRATLFSAFAPADGSTARHFGGAGLGLTISSRLVALMGGELRVESEEGKGSTFLFDAWFDPAPDPPAPAPLPPGRALLVEDCPFGRAALVETLSGFGLKVVAAADGAEAEAAILGGPFDVFVVDSRLPDAAGAEIARRAGAGRAALMLESDEPRSVAAGLRRLMKPVKESDLRAALAAILLPGGAAAAPVVAAAPGARPLRVLLAEDNVVNQRMMIRLLERAGHEVTLAENGREALNLARRGGFDVVLMDMQMPHVDGYEATAGIRAWERISGGRVPIVALTAHALKGDRERCLEAGADDYLSKPVDAKRLNALLADLPRRLAGNLTRGE